MITNLPTRGAYSSINPVFIAETTFVNDFKSIVNSHKGSDVQLVLSDDKRQETIKVHSQIIGIR